MSVTHWLRMAMMELRIAFRKPGAYAMATITPVLFAAMSAVGARPTTADGWAAVLPVQLLVLVMMPVYLNLGLLLVARRSSLVLKRLRTSAMPRVLLIAGMVVPPVVLSAVQIMILLGIHTVWGFVMPSNIWLVAASLFGMTILCAVWGVAISTVISTTERAQVYIMPMFFLAILGVMLVALFNTAWKQALVLLLPFVGVTDMLTKGWGGLDMGIQALPGGVNVLAADVVVTLVWAGLAWWLIRTKWTWDPRSG